MKCLLAAVSVFISCICYSQDGDDYVFIEIERDYTRSPLYVLEDNTVFFGDCRLLHLNTLSLSKSCDLIDYPSTTIVSPKGDMLFVTSLLYKEERPSYPYVFVSYMYNVKKKKIDKNRGIPSSDNYFTAIHPNARLIATARSKYPNAVGRSSDHDLYLANLQGKPISRKILISTPDELFFSEDGTKLHVLSHYNYRLFCVDANKGALKECSLNWGDHYFPTRSDKSPNKVFSIETRAGDVLVYERGGEFYLPIPINTTGLIEGYYVFSRDSRALVIRGQLDGKYGLIVVKLPERASKLTPPAFNCAKAATKVEITICADDNISLLDATLDRNYKQINAALRMADDKIRTAQLIDTQRAWLKQRNACETAQCLTDAYTRRIEELCEQHPESACPAADQ
jgi:uncharacterized protein YecT (DUF1311 family)